VGAAFGFVPLPLPVIAASVAILLGYVVAAEVAKGWFFRSERTGSQ
jgi:Mg2+-importing ATPase